MKRLFKTEGFWLTMLTLMGLVFWFVILWYRFTAFLLWGYVGIRCVYKLLARLKEKKPRLGKVLKIVFTVCVVVVLCLGVVTEVLVYSNTKGAKDPESEYVLVLGAGVNGTVPSRSLYQRLLATYDYMTQYPDSICIVSGGQGPGEDMTEALCMYNWLTERGIDPVRIWQEDKATSTQENIAFTLNLIEEKTGERPTTMAILSSEYHLYRAGLMAEDQGITMLGYPAKTRPLPLRWHYAFREMFALWKYWVFG